MFYWNHAIHAWRQGDSPADLTELSLFDSQATNRLAYQGYVKQITFIKVLLPSVCQSVYST